MAPLDHELPQRLDRLVAQLCSGDAQSADDPPALEQLLELTGGGGFTPRAAVHLLVTNNLAFVPFLCTQIKSLAYEEQEEKELARKSADGCIDLLHCVCLLKRLVEKLVDKERELHKVATLLMENAVFQSFAQLIDGPEGEASLPGRVEEGELRSWVMIIIRWCYNYDKTTQLGKVESLYAAHDELFRIGFYTKVVQIFGAGPVTETTRVAATLLQGVADCPKTKFREKLRKSGVIMLASSRLAGDPNFRMCSILLYNMSRSVSTHNSLREADLLAAAQKLLDANESLGPVTDPVVLLSLTLAVANVYGTDTENAEEAEAFLSQQDVSAEVVRMMRNALSGLDGIPLVQDWDVSGEEVAFMACCLSQHATFNKQMVEAGLLETIKQMLEQGEEGTLPCVRTLLSLSYSLELGEAIRSAKITAKLVELTRAEDLRVSDAAKACLMELGYDMQRNIFDSQSIQRRHGTSVLTGIASFDVFLSHRRVDSKDFARALFNLLTQRGYSTYLDFEYLKELSDLRHAVSRCKNFIFILSDHIFDSFWCKEELMTAVHSGCNIILVVKEGSKWVNTDGQDVYDFPPANFISALPEEAQRVFANNVAIKHSDEYYQSFVDKVMGRLVPPKETQAGNQRSHSQTKSNSAALSKPVTAEHIANEQAGPSMAPNHGSASESADSSHVHNNQYSNQLLETQQMFTEATERLQASFSDINSKMQTQLVQSNASELASVRQALSADLTNMQLQFTSEVSHMRRQITTDILEVRREVAAEMAQVKFVVNELHGSLQNLSSGAQQERWSGRGPTQTHSHQGNMSSLALRAPEGSAAPRQSVPNSSAGEQSRTSPDPVEEGSGGRQTVCPDLALNTEAKKTSKQQRRQRQQQDHLGAGHAGHVKANYTRRERTVLPELPHVAGKARPPIERRAMHYTFLNGERSEYKQ